MRKPTEKCRATFIPLVGAVVVVVVVVLPSISVILDSKSAAPATAQAIKTNTSLSSSHPKWLENSKAKHELRLIRIAQFHKLFTSFQKFAFIFRSSAASTLAAQHFHLDGIVRHFRNKYVGNCANVPRSGNTADTATKSRATKKLARFSAATQPICRMVFN